jgi:hypothetical protein
MIKKSIKNNILQGALLVTCVIAQTHSAIAVTLSGDLASESKTPVTQSTEKASTLARAMKQFPAQTEQNILHAEKTLTLDISELQDSSGLVYLGAEVTEVELSHYLSQLKDVLGEEHYAIYRQHQAARDHQSFHVTLVNPYEYQTINKEKLNISQKIRVTLHGLGKVEKEDKASYFVVASSSDGQFMRQNLLLKNKDFHVTLGFYPNDIYGVSKGRDTLINK